MLGEDGLSGLRVLRGARHDLRAPRLDHRAPVRLLLVRDLDHVDLALEPDQPAGERERASPLPGAGLGREAGAAFLLVVVRLRHRGVRLVASGRADSLVLVEDPRARADRLLEAVRTEERRRTPEAVELEDLLGDLDLGFLADLLSDERHREERREVVRPDRLPGARMQHGLRGGGHVREDVVPATRETSLLEQELRLTRSTDARLLHGASIDPRPPDCTPPRGTRFFAALT